MPSTAPRTAAAGGTEGGGGGFTRGKTIFVLAVVVGCFAILWPKVFYPMFTASVFPIGEHDDDHVCCDVISLKDTNAYQKMTEVCTNIIRQEIKVDSGQGQPQQKVQIRKPTAVLCRNEILKTCGVDILVLLQDNAAITKEYKESLSQLRSYNTSHCLKINYGVDFGEMGLPRTMKGPFSSPSHMRPERPFRSDQMVHPALREKGKAIPTPNLPRRTIEREARPGPVPGLRPPVGGAGHIPTAPKGSGTMGIVMPMYTIGIVCFFVYTLVKILFKKNPDDIPIVPQPGRPPILKDYGMDPEHRKFVFAEEYANGSEKSMKDDYNKEDRDLGIRRKSSGGKGRFHEDKRRIDPETDTTDAGDDIDVEQSPVQMSMNVEIPSTTDLYHSQGTETEAKGDFLLLRELDNETDLDSCELKSIITSPILTIEPLPSPPYLNNDNEISPTELTQSISLIQSKSNPLEPMEPSTSLDLYSSDIGTDEPRLTTTTANLIESSDTINLNNSTTTTAPTTTADNLPTSQDIATAALFFDETIDIPDSDFDTLLYSISTNKAESEEEPKETSMIKPTLEILEYASDIVNEILEDVTRTDAISTSTCDDVPFVPLHFDDESDVTQIPGPIPCPEPAFNTITIDVPVINLQSNTSKCLNTDSTTTKDEARGSEASSLPPEMNRDRYFLNRSNNENITTPHVTLIDDIRKNSEPIITGRSKSDLNITPVDDNTTTGDPLDALSGYVTMVDENQTRPKAFLRNLRSGVEITSFDEGIEGLNSSNGSSQDSSHRVMSMDSSDSVNTVKEIDEDNIKDLEIVEDISFLKSENGARKSDEPLVSKTNVSLTELIPDLPGDTDTMNLINTNVAGTFVEESASLENTLEQSIPSPFPETLKSDQSTKTLVDSESGIKGTQTASSPEDLQPIGQAEENHQKQIDTSSQETSKPVEPEVEIEPKLEIGESKSQVPIAQPEDAHLEIIEPKPQMEIAETNAQTEEKPELRTAEPKPELEIPQTEIAEPKPHIEIIEPKPQMEILEPKPAIEIAESKPQTEVEEAKLQMEISEPKPQIEELEPPIELSKEESQIKIAEIDPLGKLSQTEPQITTKNFEPIVEIVQSQPIIETTKAELQEQIIKQESETQEIEKPELVMETTKSEYQTEIIKPEPQIESTKTKEVEASKPDSQPHFNESEEVKGGEIEIPNATSNQQPFAIELDFEPLDDPETIELLTKQLSASRNSATKPEEDKEPEDFDMEFIPEAQSHSVPPVTLESCTNPLKASMMMALETLITEPQQPDISITDLNSNISPIPTDLVGQNINEFVLDTTDSQSQEPTTTTTTSRTEIDKTMGMGSVKPNEILGESDQTQDVFLSQPMPQQPMPYQTVVPQIAQSPPVVVTPIPVIQQKSLPCSESQNDQSDHKELEKVEPVSVEGVQEEQNRNESGHRDRDAIVTAVKGILQTLAEQTPSKKVETESLSTSESDKKLELETEVIKKEDKPSTPKKASQEEADVKPPASVTEDEGTNKTKSSMKSQSSVEKEVKFQLPAKEIGCEDDEEPEEEARPPTPPRTLSKKSKHLHEELQISMNVPIPHELTRFAQELWDNIVEQTATAAIAAVKAQSSAPGPGGHGHRETLSVLGIEETAEMESGEKWDDRTPTPTFRTATPPATHHRPPTPPEHIPSIFLEGPLPSVGQQFLVSDAHVEIECSEDEFENLSAPVVLSGRVTLSVLSGSAVDEITNASCSLSDDNLGAGGSRGKDRTAIKAEKGLSNKPSSKKGPSTNTTESRVLKNDEDDDSADVDLTSYLTAEGDSQNKMQDTEGDISVMDGLDEKHNELPRDEE